MTRKEKLKSRQAFLGAKHGWAFCNKEMLASKIARCEPLANFLEDFQELEAMKQAYRDK